VTTRSPRPALSETPRRRPWFAFGPGLGIALLASGFILYQRTRIPKGYRPPLEKTVISAWDSEKKRVTPEIAFLLSKAQSLNLSEAQVGSLKRLQEEWQKASAPKRERLSQAATEFQKWMKEQQGKRAVSLKAIQERASLVSLLSAELASLRRDFWEQALAVLTAEQQQALEPELQKWRPGRALMSSD